MSKVFEATQRAKAGGRPAAVLPESPARTIDPAQAAAMFPGETPAAPAAEAIPAAIRAQPIAPLRRQPADPVLASKLITSNESRAAFTEYRRLAGTLHQAQVEHRIRVVMVTSAMPGEGKSLTAANVALTLAHVYHRSVLLVDGDTRRPTLHQIFGGHNDVGLLECLRNGRLLPSAKTQIGDALHLLAGGRPVADPVNELSSSRVADFFAEVSREYDWVIVDTPPAVVLPDVELIAPIADAFLVVVQAGRTPYKKVQRLVDTLGRDRILGVILNRAEAEDLPGTEYGDYYYGSYAEGERR